jgi:hypothetical protein
MYSHKKQESCIKWLVNKKLSLHLYKTECILFRPNRKLKTITDFQINCNGHLIKSQRNIKYLGIINIDLDLYGDRTANIIIKNVI